MVVVVVIVMVVTGIVLIVVVIGVGTAACWNLNNILPINIDLTWDSTIRLLTIEIGCAVGIGG